MVCVGKQECKWAIQRNKFLYEPLNRPNTEYVVTESYILIFITQLNMLSATTENATRLLTSQTAERRPLQRTGLPNLLIIQCKFFFLFIGQEATTWPANNCPQIIVCSCAMLSNCVWLQIIFCSCVLKWNYTFLLLAIDLAWKWPHTSLPVDIH